jgi:hypothetical protein
VRGVLQATPSCDVIKHKSQIRGAISQLCEMGLKRGLPVSGGCARAAAEWNQRIPVRIWPRVAATMLHNQ